MSQICSPSPCSMGIVVESYDDGSAETFLLSYAFVPLLYLLPACAHVSTVSIMTLC